MAKKTNVTYKGIPASPGISMGPVFVYLKQEVIVPSHQVMDTDGEVKRLDDALSTARAQISNLLAKATTEVGDEEAAIFEAHDLLLQDPTLISAFH